ncbi:MAG: hypothetical protein HY866_23000 [Chloroflexi bacterium]|nr:hypothetical protein [Chloroflexota bacterium]
MLTAHPARLIFRPHLFAGNFMSALSAAFLFQVEPFFGDHCRNEVYIDITPILIFTDVDSVIEKRRITVGILE